MSESLRELIIGRGPDCDLQLDDEFASTRHARIWQDDTGQVWIEDLGSTNGTTVNGLRVYDALRVGPGDVIRIGRTDLPWTANPPTV